ncbi:zona pellucida sperm-binding protein 3 [Gouania willdenowi]|uniref:zona pellucida sperm-binding protein 3 n=1 Tax=Gouania willdenowi TaxID=441366 RepID=UPI00105552FB|nr:zona pellucida sperm-binding protein 3-like [Gouania willdenowi]
MHVFQSNKGCLIISIKLSYNLDAPVLRELPFETTIFCKFPRFFHSYKVGFHPQLRGGTVYRQLQSKSKFVITPQDASGKNILGTRSYTLGQLMFFQASGPDVSHSGDKRLYINKCYMTASQNPNSSPRYTIIDNQGCMVDGKVSAESKFLKCGLKMVQRFSVAAFIFRSSSSSTTTSQQIYMHCEITVGSHMPTPSLKACNYDSTSKTWKELHGADSVCACCESTCPSAQAKAPRSFITTPSWKVGLTSEDETKSVSVAPRMKSQEVVPFEMGAGGADHEDFLENWDHDY